MTYFPAYYKALLDKKLEVRPIDSVVGTEFFEMVTCLEFLSIRSR
jgi:hypothetical protein